MLSIKGRKCQCITTIRTEDKKWLVDFTAFHYITGDLANLSLHSEYGGIDEVIHGDGSGLDVTHIGSLVYHSPLRTFKLCNTRCVPNLQRTWFPSIILQNKIMFT